MIHIELLLPYSHDVIMGTTRRGSYTPTAIDIDFNKTLIKYYSRIVKVSVNEGHDDPIYEEFHPTEHSISIELKTCYDVDTFEFLDPCHDRVHKHRSSFAGYSDCKERSKITRVNDEYVTYRFIFDDIEELLEFIRYYDSLSDDYNILDDYYHFIFARNRDYSNYLKTKHWQEKRKVFLKKANYKCQLCSSKDLKLHVHHNTYDNIGNEKDEDLIVLCEECHAKFHNK